jgi:SPP1 family predicted phage head-tail adaptor
MATLDAGSMTEWIVVERRGSVRDASGQRSIAWSPDASIGRAGGLWAKAEPLRGREAVIANQSEAPIDVRFRLRYTPRITENHRIVWRGVPYEVVGPPADVDGGRETLEVMTRALRSAPPATPSGAP